MSSLKDSIIGIINAMAFYTLLAIRPANSEVADMLDLPSFILCPSRQSHVLTMFPRVNIPVSPLVACTHSLGIRAGRDIPLFIGTSIFRPRHDPPFRCRLSFTHALIW